MIERFYDPISGNVELDGVDLTKLNLKWLKDQVFTPNDTNQQSREHLLQSKKFQVYIG